MSLKGKVNGLMEKRVMDLLNVKIKKKMYLFMLQQLKTAGLKFLNEGDKLTFDLEDGDKGPSAVKLKKDILSINLYKKLCRVFL